MLTFLASRTPSLSSPEALAEAARAAAEDGKSAAGSSSRSSGGDDTIEGASSFVEWHDLTGDGASWLLVARGACPLLASPKEGKEEEEEEEEEEEGQVEGRAPGVWGSWQPGVDFEGLWETHPAERRAFTRTVKVEEGSGAGEEDEEPVELQCVENRWSQAFGVSYSYGGLTNEAKPTAEHPFLPPLLGLLDGLRLKPAASADEAEGARKAEGDEGVSSDGDVDGGHCCCRYNMALQNWYRAEDSISAHSDDEPQHVPRAPIFSFSWGAPRRFVLKPKQTAIGNGVVTTHEGATATAAEAAALTTTTTTTTTTRTTRGPAKAAGGGGGGGAAAGAVRCELLLRDGDVVVMGGACQETHKHFAPPLTKPELAALRGEAPGPACPAAAAIDPLLALLEGRRVNLTVRCTRDEHDEGPL